MELTGKCKVEFEKWYLTKDYYDDYYIAFVPKKGMMDEFRCINFKEFPESMQWGVYVDFFDSVNLFIEVIVVEIDDFSFQIFKKESAKSLSNGFTFNTRPEARNAAIEKANEIYNDAH